MFITADKFDESKVVFKPIIKRTEPVGLPYQRIPIKYMYDGEEKPLFIRTHTRSSATAERQRVSYTHLSRLTH